MSTTAQDGVLCAPRFECMNKFVHIKVGVPPKQFSVHYGLAAKLSKFIKDLTPNEDGNYLLDTAAYSSQAFELFMRYSYSTHLGRTDDPARIAEAWLLAGYLEAPKFAQAMLDTAVRKGMVSGFVVYVLNNIAKTHSKRKDLLQWFTTELVEGRHELSDTMAEKVLSSDLLDLYRSLLERSRNQHQMAQWKFDGPRKRFCDETTRTEQLSEIAGEIEIVHARLAVHEKAKDSDLETERTNCSPSIHESTRVVEADPVSFGKLHRNSQTVQEHALPQLSSTPTKDPRINRSAKKEMPKAQDCQLNPVNLDGASEASGKPSVFKCRRCLQNFSSEQSMHTHVARDHPEILRGTDGRPLWDRKEIDRIKVPDRRRGFSPHGSRQERCVCRFCKQSFDSGVQLRRHIEQEGHHLTKTTTGKK